MVRLHPEVWFPKLLLAERPTILVRRPEASQFVEIIAKKFPFKIECVQTDNGFEFTNRLSWQAFMKNKKTIQGDVWI